MKKLIAVFLCLMTVFSLVACSNEEHSSEWETDPVTEASKQNEPKEEQSSSPKVYFKLELKDLGFYYEIYDKQGNVVLAKETMRPTEITMLGESIVDIEIAMGTGLAFHTYYDVEGNRFSEEYSYVVAASGNLVAYIDAPMKDPLQHRKLVVRDIFDKTVFYKSFSLDFSETIPDMPIESASFTEGEAELEVVYWSERPATTHSITIPIRRNASEGEKLSEEERAMKAYEEALNGKINLYDPVVQDYSLLKDFKTPYNQIPLCEAGSLGYAYVDLDGDMSNELVIDCGDTLILRYYEGSVCVYSFTFRSLYDLQTDGSYAWNHTGSNFEYGESQITFDGEELKTKELYRIVNDGEPNAEYYIEGKQVTEEELLEYIEAHPKTKVKFAPLEVSWLNKISRTEALQIAADYWQIEDGDVDYAAGKKNVCRITLIDTTSYHKNVYHIAHQDEIYRRNELDQYTFSSLETTSQIYVDATTGECIPYGEPDGKG